MLYLLDREKAHPAGNSTTTTLLASFRLQQHAWLGPAGGHHLYRPGKGRHCRGTLISPPFPTIGPSRSPTRPTSKKPNTMAAGPLKIAFFALCVSTVAVQLSSVLDPSATATATSAEASPPLHGAVLQILLPFIVMEAIFASAPFLYLHARRAAAADGGGASNRHLSELGAFILCVAVGLLEHFLFVRPAGGAVDGGAQARRALGLAALRVLPASATATFFLGVGLVYAHVGGSSGNGPVPEPTVRILSEITLEAAAALMGITAVAVCTLL
nr:hypothetical protein SEVIR_4G074700v2 [Setaria viridis]TKW20263.1 hypothetical protein SEVIR_4G074700v2 [Setaria viridis]